MSDLIIVENKETGKLSTIHPQSFDAEFYKHIDIKTYYDKKPVKVEDIKVPAGEGVVTTTDPLAPVEVVVTDVQGHACPKCEGKTFKTEAALKAHNTRYHKEA